MGQFASYGLEQPGQVGLTQKGNRAHAESVVVKKPKSKPKVAGAGSPPPDPKKPPKNFNKGIK
jgi:hypothetical protein